MSVFHNNALIGSGADTGAAAAAAGPIKSLRFNDGDSAYLNRTPSSGGDRQKWTWSCWVKRTTLGTEGAIFSTYAGAHPNTSLFWESDGLKFHDYTSSYQFRLGTTEKYRDPSAWYHIVLAYNSTEGTASDRAKLWVNGTLQTLSGTTVPQNHSTDWNSATRHDIGIFTAYFDGYMADIYFIDGSALDYTSFGAFDDNGVWQAAAYSGTFGTNGFHLLDFANEATVGHDASGNGNDFTANNITNETPTSLPAVVFDGTGDYANLGSSSDLSMGTGDFTVECFITKDDSSHRGIWQISSTSGGLQSTNYTQTLALGYQSNRWQLYAGGSQVDGASPPNTGSVIPRKWYHLAVVRNSGTTKLYVDGTEEISTSDTYDYTGTHMAFGGYYSTSYLHKGKISNLRVVKGTAVYTSAFTRPAAPLSNITNTKLLCCQSSTSATAATVSPTTITANGNTYAVQFSDSSSSQDVLFDVPVSGTQSDTGAGGEVSGNYCTLNPLDNESHTLSNGNLDITNFGTTRQTHSTILPSSGKWYAEFTCKAAMNDVQIGVANNAGTSHLGADSNSWGVISINGNRIHGGGSNQSSYGSSYTTGDLIMVALDLDNGKWYAGKNGTWFNSGNPANGTNPAHTGLSGNIGFAVGSNNTGGDISCNFGQRAFAYTAPSGYKALCTTNLSTPTIANAADHFNIKTWTGTGSSHAITGYTFAPDFAWIKARNNAGSHALLDTVRGNSKVLRCDNDLAEVNNTSVFTSFDNDGFTLGADTSNGWTNFNTWTYVGWAWKAASSTPSNTDGDITSSVRANQSAGFSIVSFNLSVTNTEKSVGHGLNTAPTFYIVKNRSSDDNWYVYTTAVDGTLDFKYLNTTDAFSASSRTLPTSSVFSFASSTTGDHIAYCFAPVAGYSAFGTYEGNGSSSDGPFIYLGFRPAFFLLKSTTTGTYNWHVIDSARSTFNPVDDVLRPNLNNSEVANYGGIKAIFCANGIKLNANWLNVNNDGDTFLYAAFAENPFQANGGLAR